MITLADGKITERSGFAFVNLTENQVSAVQRYIMELERQRKARQLSFTHTRDKSGQANESGALCRPQRPGRPAAVQGGELPGESRQTGRARVRISVRTASIARRPATITRLRPLALAAYIAPRVGGTQQRVRNRRHGPGEIAMPSDALIMPSGLSRWVAPAP
jgi:hypothetical protein